MDTQEYHKNNKNQLLITLLFSIIPLGLFSLFLIFKSDDLVFANEPSTLSSGEIKEFLYLPNSIKEKISYGPKLITVKRGLDTTKILTTLTDVNDILRENSIVLGENDSVYLDTLYVINGSVIKIIKTSNVIFEQIEEIPFKVEALESNELLRGREMIIQEGKNGIKKQVYINTYEDGFLVESNLVDELILKEPITEIKKVGTSWYSLEEIEKHGYNCPYWYSVVDSGPYTDEEKKWLKFIMECESGCNAESNKGTYKGLFQWSPYWWSKQFNENIFDGYAQIKNTIKKYRSGEYTRASQWPACHAKYLREN